MQRILGWEQRLGDLFAAARKRTFAWGTHDCLLFAADSLVAQFGYDPAATWRGQYSDEIGALRCLREFIGAEGTLTEAMALAGARIAAETGAREIKPAFAQRGNIGLIKGAAHDCFAVVAPSGRDLVAVSPNGLERVSLKEALKVWAVA